MLLQKTLIDTLGATVEAKILVVDVYFSQGALRRGHVATRQLVGQYFADEARIAEAVAQLDAVVTIRQGLFGLAVVELDIKGQFVAAVFAHIVVATIAFVTHPHAIVAHPIDEHATEHPVAIAGLFKAVEHSIPVGGR